MTVKCDCIIKVEKALKDTNTMLDIPIEISVGMMTIRADRVKISTVKRDPNKKEIPKPMIAAYCPFCGKQYPKPPI